MISRTFLLALAAALLALAGCNPSNLNPSASPAANDLRTKLVELASKKGGAGGSDAAASTEMPTGFATFKGKITVVGAPKPLGPQPVSKDHAVCAPGGRSPLEQTYVIGPGGGLANVVIFADGVPDAWAHETQKKGAATGEIVFDQAACLFAPHLLACRVGQPVVLKNSDGVLHNTNIQAVAGRKADQLIPSNGSTVYTATKQESKPFPVSCGIHTWMTGWMIARNDGYFAVTRDNGEFEIPNVPAGVKLTFRVWQEKLGFIDKVKVGGTDVTWKGKKLVETFQPDETKTLEVQIDAAAFDK